MLRHIVQTLQHWVLIELTLIFRFEDLLDNFLERRWCVVQTPPTLKRRSMNR